MKQNETSIIWRFWIFCVSLQAKSITILYFYLWDYLIIYFSSCLPCRQTQRTGLSGQSQSKRKTTCLWMVRLHCPQTENTHQINVCEWTFSMSSVTASLSSSPCDWSFTPRDNNNLFNRRHGPWAMPAQTIYHHEDKNFFTGSVIASDICGIIRCH